MMTTAADQPWIAKGLRFALHMGVASPEKPLFRELVGSLDPLDHIRFAADIGFAGISDNGLKLRPAAVQAAMGEELARLGLEMGSFTLSPMGSGNSYWGNPDPAFDEAFAVSVDEAIEVAKRVGGREITLCALVAEGIDFDRQIAALGRRVAGAADRVAAAGFRLSIEPTSLSRTPFFLVHHVADALKVMGPDHPGVSLMFDTGHLHEMDGDPAMLFEQYQDRIHTVQIADVAQRVEPGAGNTDFVAVFATLRRLNFKGLLELEHYLSVESKEGEQTALDRLAGLVAAS